MIFYLQDPADPSTTYLLEVLLSGCRGARKGGGAFAWASQQGVKLLLEDSTFTNFASNNSFELVIGVDAVTDVKALAALRRAAATMSGLTVHAFLHGQFGSIFHPKVCWFRKGKGGILITGSGNLTDGGLRGNWEAFTVTPLNAEELNLIESQWALWKSRHQETLLSLDDEQVIARASKNTGWGEGGVSRGRRTIKTAIGAPVVSPAKIGDVALVAEIPRGSTRWNQANFDLDNYENFFGAKVGTQRHMFFQHVNADGTVGDVESRPSVAVKSSNWRFELAAAAGIPYPRAGRPIGVFVREAARTFRYRLLMPSDSDYKIIQKFLEDRWSGPSSRIRRVRVNIEELHKTWPKSPLWRAEKKTPTI